MTISSDSGWGLWTSQIVRRALIKTHRVPVDQPIPAEELELATDALNNVLDSLQDQKVFLWAVERTTLTVVSGQIVYNLADDTLDVMQDQISYLGTGSTSYVPMRLVSRENYYQQPDRAVTTGSPLQACVERNRTAVVNGHELQGLLTMSLYPVPDNSTDVVHYTRVRALHDFSNATSDADVPRRWALALIGLLAAELAPEYGLDIAERNDLVARARAHEQRAMRGDRESVGLRMIPRMR